VRFVLIGVVHLPPLPGSPRALPLEQALARTSSDAKALANAGFDGLVIENFNDVPFFASSVPPITVAAMTACALEARRVAPSLTLGINVLRNDAEAALSIAHVTGAAFVRVNVHGHARLTDQGVIQGRAAETLRLRASLGAKVAIWADVAVKHSAPLAPLPPEEEARDLEARALADALIVTGTGTGVAVDLDLLRRVRQSSKLPLYVGSGATEATLASLRTHATGIIVGTALRQGAKPGGAIDEKLAASFARAFRA
jgi:membrane complex biogenesis BtpA family protein